ncbi:MAG: excinuclease ABC subunit UvrC [Planctomycetaceae bacterium]|nr:excinuclease ABC subunit UvrC [Planctomycetaceae bacterium]
MSNLSGDDIVDDVGGVVSVASEKVRQFPHSPGVYLMKDSAQRVIYIGKAKDLRNRAGSYFQKSALDDPRVSIFLPEIVDIDYILAESEVDALLLEARLIKDIQPKYNRDLKDSKTFPYLQIRTRESYPRVEITREPKDHGVRLFGPFTNSSGLRGAVIVLQKIFKFRTCSLDIKPDDKRFSWFRPCILHSINQCSGACNFRITSADYRKNIQRLIRFLEGGKRSLIVGLKREMQAASDMRQYELAAELRNQVHDLETLDKHGDIETHVQPEAFVIDPRRGVVGLKKVLKLDFVPRTMEGIDIAHLGGSDMVASLVCFTDGLPFKPGYRRYKIKTVHGIDDFACMSEVVTRRFSGNGTDSPPDILLIDGGKGQLNAALAALERTSEQPKLVISLAKKDEEIYVPNQDEPIRLSRHSFALRLLQYVRDEAHRFAQHYHHILRKNRFTNQLNKK